MQAMERAVHVSGRLPLIVDNTGNDVAETFLRYQSCIHLDAKGLVVRLGLGGESLESLQEGCREKLVSAMSLG
jgi:hypothetical protein